MSGQKRGRRDAGEEGFDSPEEELKSRCVVDCAGCHYRPDALTPSVAGSAAGALCDESVDDHEADGLLRDVVGRVDARSGDESEVCGAVLVESFRDVDGGFMFRNLCCGGDDDFVSLGF